MQLIKKLLKPISRVLKISIIALILFYLIPNLLFIVFSTGLYSTNFAPISDDEMIKYLKYHHTELKVLSEYDGTYTIDISDPKTWQRFNTPTAPIHSTIIKLYTSEDFTDINQFIIQPLEKPNQEIRITFLNRGDWKHGFHTKALVYLPEPPQISPVNRLIKGDTNKYMENNLTETIWPDNVYDISYYRALGDGWYIEHSIYYGFDD